MVILRGVAELGPEFPQEHSAQAVEVGDEDFLAVVTNAGGEALAHLVAGFVGEGEAEDVFGLHASRCDQSSRALGKRARLPRPRPGERKDSA